MQVILKERVPKLGNPWDVVEVKPGFARNFLFPNLAIPATKDNLKKVDEMKAKTVAKAEAVLENVKEIAEKLKGAVLTFKKKARGEKLYGALKEKDVIDALIEEKKIELKADMVIIKEPIKTLGTHEISLKLNDEVSVKIKLTIEEEK